MPKPAGILLGFIGSGDTSPENTFALLSDFIDAHGASKFILPMVPSLWSAGLASVADFAIQNRIPYEAIITDETAGAKGLKAYVDRANAKTKIAKPGLKLVNSLAGNSEARLIVLWDDSSEVAEVLRLAKEKDLGMLDLTQGLAEIELNIADGQQPKEQEPTMATEQALTWEYISNLTDQECEAVADSLGIDHTQFGTWDEVKNLIFEQHGVYTMDDLSAMSDDQIQEMAEASGIDHQQYATWDEVRQVILDAQDQSAPVDGMPTVEEIGNWEFGQLKSFAEQHGIEVPPRTRTPGYVTAITSWLEGGSGGASSTAEPGGAVASTNGAVPSELAERVETTYQAVTQLGVFLDELKATLETGLQDLATMIASSTNGNGAGPAAGVQKAAGAAKAPAVAKAAPTPTKAAPAPTKAAAPVKKAPAGKA